jgi:hypothetical protein
MSHPVDPFWYLEDQKSSFKIRISQALKILFNHGH